MSQTLLITFFTLLMILIYFDWIQIKINENQIKIGKDQDRMNKILQDRIGLLEKRMLERDK